VPRSREREKVKRETGAHITIQHPKGLNDMDRQAGAAPRCCKPDETDKKPLCEERRMGRRWWRKKASQKTGLKQAQCQSSG